MLRERLQFSSLVALLTGDVSSGAEGVWAAQHSWCPPPKADPEPRPHSAGPTRPRSADPLRRRLDVPVDAGMAALGFLSDEAQPTGQSPSCLRLPHHSMSKSMHRLLFDFVPKHAHVRNCKLCFYVSEAHWLVGASSRSHRSRRGLQEVIPILHCTDLV